MTKLSETGCALGMVYPMEPLLSQLIRQSPGNRRILDAETGLKNIGRLLSNWLAPISLLALYATKVYSIENHAQS